MTTPPQQPQQPDQPWSQPQQPQQPAQWQQPQQQWQPQPQQQWGQQPAPWQQQPQGPGLGATLKSLGLGVWTYVGTLVATFIAAFLPVGSATDTEETFGLLSASMNWWGNVSLSAPMGGDLLNGLLQTGMAEELAEIKTFFVVATLIILALQALAVFFAYSAKKKSAAIFAFISYALQILMLLGTLSIIVDDSSGALGTSIGWWLWLLIVIVGIVLSIKVLRNKGGNVNVGSQFQPQFQNQPGNWTLPNQPNQPGGWSQPNQSGNWGQPQN